MELSKEYWKINNKTEYPEQSGKYYGNAMLIIKRKECIY